MLLVTLQSYSSPTTAVTTSKPANALLEWKSRLPSQSQVLLSSWNKSSSDTAGLCSWKGIVCDAWQSVTGLNLVHVPINGTLRGLDFSSLPNLTMIVLVNCLLSGVIVPVFSNLTKLTDLDLGLNSFSSGFPAFLGYLTSLQSLGLTDNLLKGTLPGSIAALTNLTSLNLNNNQFSGDFTSFIRLISSLLLQPSCCPPTTSSALSPVLLESLPN
ncbi:hypothetical protein MLD38_037546 [Melastoma candidum]|uniref:Uncharacterized protein n=1 Tax=Melastoma candidum TaxID=119954 RepID=A0ACB9LNL9_9MYRT|nr:hypothetical protein MLD38_037546 [Melastoma candidum]